MSRVQPKSHPWKRTGIAGFKLREDKKEWTKKRKLQYRHDNLDWCRLHERNWHRAQTGKPLDDPIDNRGGKPRTLLSERIGHNYDFQV